MVGLPSKNWRHNTAGLTLIEVLVALAIVAIAMTAIIKATTEMIRAEKHLQTKTSSLWAASEMLNAAKVGLVHLPFAPDALTTKTAVLETVWIVRGSREKTPNPHIDKIIVEVFAQEEDTARVASLEGYIFHAE